MKLKVKVYNGVKYEAGTELVTEITYDEVSKITVLPIDDNRVYALGFDEVDEYGEYAIIEFMDGQTSTFRNSHVDIFQNY